jgi:hypothetical protein
MCCGQSEADEKWRQAMSDDMPAAKRRSDPRVALYAVRPGDSIDIVGYGRATNTGACFVPESLLPSLCEEGRLAPLEPDVSPVAEPYDTKQDFPEAVKDVQPRKRKKE